ncbi:integrase catalytic domain-containing protein [Trichonephila clavipes]|nr:integrase catalytic domain-containing protein [Trichonephila clavipes]
MAPKELPELTMFNRRKAHLLGQITRIRNSLENVDSPLNQVEIRTKLASLSEVKAKIDKLRTESYRILSDEELMDFETSLDTMEVDADNLEVSLNTLLESSNVDTSELSVKNDFANYNVKLPSINLPEFSGQYIDWLQFKSQFVSLIHDNACLSDSQKTILFAICPERPCKTIANKAIGIKAESSCDPDDQAMQQLKSTVRFNSGRYEVGRFIRDPTLYIQYSEILKEYESQGIIERVLETEKPTDRAVFYLPHQAVFRQESLTTKMRIVFDASSHEDGQPSLNDCIWSGGNLNPNIFHLIISFRLNTIAITADIERAFLQISLRDEDRDAVRFLFPDIKSNQTDPYKFQVYRFKRVMFGVNVSPFLLSATIKHHIENYREQYPAATEMLDTCLYVDDVISGADDISQALKVSKDAETIMKNASMKLRKWNSNDQTLMRTWEKEGLETHPRHPDDSSKIPSSKVLGIPWDVVHDYFTIDVKGLLQLDTSKPITKRIVLQSAGKIYDPVGFLSPYTIRLKCLLQELWLRKLSWDDELPPPDIHAVWSQWWLELPFLSELKIPRKILDSSGDSSEVQIHTFSDASQKAYGAAAFLRVKHKDRIGTDGRALLAARLAKEVKKILDQKCSTRAFFWTDSQVTLHWIKGPSHRWKPFVANRVREIQSLTDPNSWFHCSGKDNPADLLTRGISVDALTTNSKWWNGSSFLRQIDFQTKGLDEAIPERVYLTEMRKNSNPKEDISLTLTVTKNNFLENIIDISNNYVKLIRVVSFLYRFIHNCRTRITKIKGPLTSQEVSHAENWLIHSLHEREFYEEMRKLLAGTLVLIKDENLPSTKWSTGRITEIFPGTDGKVRVVNLRDLLDIAKELGVEVDITLPRIEFKKRICQSNYYNEESVKYLLEGILEERRESKERESEKRQKLERELRVLKRAHDALVWENNCKRKDSVVTRSDSKIVPFEKEREAGLNAASDFSIENAGPVFPTQENGTEPTAVPTVKKRRINIVLSFSHDSLTTACLETNNVHVDIDAHWAETDRSGKRTRDHRRKIEMVRERDIYKGSESAREKRLDFEGAIVKSLQRGGKTILYLSPRSKVEFGTVDIEKEQLYGGFGANELTQTWCGITESECIGLFSSIKEDLRMLATELGLAPSDNLKIIELKDLITNSDRYDEEFVKDVLSVIVEERTATEK